MSAKICWSIRRSLVFLYASLGLMPFSPVGMMSRELKIRVPVPEPIFSVQDLDILMTLIPS